MKRLALFALVIVLAGCAGAKVDGIATTANALAIVGEQALSTNALYVNLCAKELIDDSQCEAWAKFFARFKAEYPFAARAYIAAVEAGNPQSAEEAARRIQTLSNELTLYFLMRGK